MPYTLDDFARRFGARVEGDGGQIVKRVASLETAGHEDISFFASACHHAALSATKAAAIILCEKDVAAFAGNRLVAADPPSCFAKIAELLNPPIPITPGIHPTAVVDPAAEVSPAARIGPNSVVEAGVVVSEGVDIGPNCNLMEGAVVGANSRFVAGVTVYPRSVIGRRCLLHSGAVIGADGFGLVREGGKWNRFPQLGRVLIKDDVEVGANTCVDRGALDDTVIGNGVKLDNHIQIGHNVTIGDDTVMAGCVGVAGSVRIGKRCMFGGRVSILDHLEIADDVTVLATSVVTRSLIRPGVYSSVLSVQTRDRWRRNVARLHRLDELFDRVKRIDERIIKGEKVE